MDVGHAVFWQKKSYTICKVTNEDNFLCIPVSFCSHVLLSFHYMCMGIITCNT